MRNELLDHVIVLNENHLRRLAQDYLRYSHQDRSQDGLNKDMPANRPTLHRNGGDWPKATPCLGGLHHRYFWAKLHEGCVKFSRSTPDPSRREQPSTFQGTSREDYDSGCDRG